MSTGDLAKNFERKFKLDWDKCFPNGVCLRIPDQVSGYKVTSQNIGDYICYVKPIFYFCELKTHKGASIPFDAIPQYDRLLKYDNVDGVKSGVIVWFYEKDIVVYIPIHTLMLMKKDGLKSFGVKHLNSDKYKSVIIPSIKKVIYMDSDYSILYDREEE